MILTDSGEVAIESLAIGDMVVTADNGSMPVLWLGRRFYRRSEGRNWTARVVPLKIAARAFDDQTPNRDLYVSQAHGIRVDGTIVAAEFYLNQRSVDLAEVDHLDTLEYFHVELASHEVIFANGAESETFFGEDREQFSNFVEYERLYGPSAPAESRGERRAVYAYRGRTALKGLLLCAAAPILGMQDPMRQSYDRVARRALEALPAA